MKRKRIIYDTYSTHVTHANRLDTEIFFRSFFLILYNGGVNGYFWITVL